MRTSRVLFRNHKADRYAALHKVFDRGEIRRVMTWLLQPVFTGFESLPGIAIKPVVTGTVQCYSDLSSSPRAQYVQVPADLF